MSLELHVDKASFKRMLDKVSDAVAHGTHPALQCFHIEVNEYALTVTASDQANTIHTKIYLHDEKYTFDEGAKFIVPASKLHPIIRQAPEGFLTLLLTGNRLDVQAGLASWEIKLPAIEYPKSALVKVDYKDSAVVSASVLRDAIAATRKSMPETAMRPSLRMLSIRKGAVTSCDGVRLSQFSLGENFPIEFTSAIPLGSVGALSDLLKSAGTSDVKLMNTDTHHCFKVGETTLMAKCLSSKYPNVEQLMLRPALENKQELVVDRAELIKAIDRVRINADTTDAMGFHLSAKSVLVSARDLDGNSSSEIIPSSWIGKDRELVVNHKYLTSLIKGVESDKCHFFLGEDTKSRKSVVLLKDEEIGFYGVVPQFSGSAKIF